MNAVTFLIDTLFDLYLMVVLLRIWLQLVRADFYNPFSQFVVKATNPLLMPLRRIIPGLGGIDLAAVILAIAVATLKIVVQLSMAGGGIPFPAVLMFGMITVLQEAFTLVFWILIIRAILSWVSQGRNPIEFVMIQLTEPFLAPIRRVLPSLGGLDLSVLVAIIALQALQILFTDLLRNLLY